MKQCTIKDCKEKRVGNGYCSSHYLRNKRHGNPNIVKQVRNYDGRYKLPEYKNYNAMKDRCNSRYKQHVANYSGRGITVCDRWIGAYGFINFLADMGPRPENYTLERKNNNKGYSPENCIWASRHQQMINTRATTKRPNIYHRPEKTIKQWFVYITINKIKYNKGFMTELEATVYRDTILLDKQGSSA